MSADRVAADSALTALAPLVWGSTYLVTTEFLPPDRPLLAATVRALPAGLILLAIGRTLPHGRWWWRAAVLGTLNIGAFLYLLFVAAYHLPGGVAALVMAVQPTIVLALSALLLKERITATHAAACALGMAGVGLLALTPRAGLDAVGVGAGLLGAMSMASGIVLTKRWGRPAGVGVLTFTGWQLSFGGILLLPVTLIGEGLPDTVDGRNVAGFAYLGFVGALLAYAVWFRGVERLPALTVSVLGFASPLAAMALGYLVLDETLSPVQLAGAVTVVVAVFLARPRTTKGRGASSDPPPPQLPSVSRAS
ncbi:EamA family transporter [Streptomyces sp. NBC_01696]|uniref:EamA family transporter n=1 Tax=unclassified Streptomyces TaxID=2593676 RepID=UPI0029AF4835|nr:MULTISPECIES: EamA family transporter [unclassified Streptomyces]MDX3431886.1 EamA family transporter [Streptomyces sp. ME01-18a]MDX3682083.1 EamA family transporter [Streptomyces sp. AK04-4c]